MTDCSLVPEVLCGKRIAVLGFGSQGRAQALNLRDVGADVVVGLRAGSGSRAEAEGSGLVVADLAEAVRLADVVMTLVPDEVQPALWRELGVYLKPGAYLGFAHGLAVHFGRVELPSHVNVFLVAPRGPGRLIRARCVDGSGFACSLAVANDPSGDTWDVARAYAEAIGGLPSAFLDTTFQEECEADLFGEQAVLCGGLVELVRAGFDTLVEAGVSPEIAYFECLHEVKLIADLMYERGIAGMRAGISNTAKFGGLTRGKRIIGDDVRAAMRAVFDDIRSGRFAGELFAESEAGLAGLNAMQREEADHPIERAGREVRRLLGLGDEGRG